MFEYDPDKSDFNEDKHGINFETATELWNDPNRLIIPAKVIGEIRYLLIGELKGTIWSSVYTQRNNNIRIISVRRARRNEKELYKNSRI